MASARRKLQMPQANKDNASGKNKPNWVDIGTLAVLTLTLLAVVY
jgi:hypothetical protein